MKGKCICNANIILEDRIIFGYLLMRNGKIAGIGEGDFKSDKGYTYEIQDAKGRYILPGIIDIHNDSFTREYEPNVNEVVPLNIAFGAFEKKLITLGITTVYHSLFYNGDSDKQNSELILKMIENLKAIKYKRFIINHRLNLNYSIHSVEGFERVIDFLDGGKIDCLTLVEYSQNGTQNDLKVETSNTDNRLSKSNNYFMHLIKHCNRRNLGTGVGNVDSIEELKGFIKLGLNFLQKAKNIEIAEYAIKNGVYVCKAANEFFQTDLYNDRKKTLDEILTDTMNILISGNSYSALLPVVFKLGKIFGNLPKAVSMATLNPAKASGIGEYCGSIKEGKTADVILVEIYDELPVVREVFIRGKQVYWCDFFE